MGRIRGRKNQRGAALLELAFGIPVLAILGLGVADMASAYSLQVSLRNAAREGAGYAQYFPAAQNASCDPISGDFLDISSKAANSDNSLSLAPNAVTVQHASLSSPTFSNYSSACNETFVAGDTVQVSVSKPFNPVSPIGVLVMGNSKMLTGVDTVQVIVK